MVIQEANDLPAPVPETVPINETVEEKEEKKSNGNHTPV